MLLDKLHVVGSFVLLEMQKLNQMLHSIFDKRTECILVVLSRPLVQRSKTLFPPFDAMSCYTHLSICVFKVNYIFDQTNH